ncbi:hypothetical protein LCGC14_1852280, partial [marine sediment metagenome]
VHIYDKPRPHRFYMLWCDPPLSNVPGFYHLSLTCPPKTSDEPVPLYVQAWWWDFGWSNAGAREAVPGCVSLSTESPWNLYKGIHEGSGTYKAFDQGIVQGYWLRRFEALLPWLKREYRIDPQRMVAMSADWAWRHGDLFAAVRENLCMIPKRSPTYIHAERFFWGPVKSSARASSRST